MVELRPLREDRRGKGDPDGSALVPEEIEEAGRLPGEMRRYPSEGRDRDRDEKEAEAEPLEQPRRHEEGEVGREAREGQQPQRDDVEDDACEDEDPRVNPSDQRPHEDHRDQRGEASRGYHQPRESGGVAQEVLAEDGKHNEGAVEAEPGEEHQARSRGVLLVLHYGKVDEGVLGGEGPPDEKEKSYHGGNSPEPDEPALEPVVPLSPVQQDLEASEPQCDEGERPVIDPAFGLFYVVRVFDQHVSQDDRDDPDGYVDIKDPWPVPVVGDPAAESGADYGAEDDADPEERHRLAVLLLREGLEHDRLRHRHHRASRQPLYDPHQDQDRQSRRGARTERGESEDDKAGKVRPLPTEEIAYPAGKREDDGVGDQVGSYHPGYLVRSRAVCSRHVRKGDVRDGSVDDLHEGAQHRREGDEVFVAGVHHGKNACGELKIEK